MQLSRRAFLRARSLPQDKSFRPPWAVEESRFLKQCSRCLECVTACPTGLLIKGEGGFPEANFTPGHAVAGCTFCGDCVLVCQPKVLCREVERSVPWRLQAIFGAQCLTQQGVVCRTCGESCEVGAIRFSPRLGGVAQPQLSAEACTGCGACLADCPTHAIRIDSIVQQGAL